MYIPNQFKEDRIEVIEDFIYKNSFSTLISVDDKKPILTHIPIELIKDKDGNKLIGHMSKGNPHWKKLKTNNDVLVVFLGSDTYISPKWYNHMNVPTWNYIAVHVTGDIRILEKTDDILPILKYQIEKYENFNRTFFSIEELTPEFLEDEIKGTIGFEIIVKNIESNFKLSQNRNLEDFTNIIKELDKKDSRCPISKNMRNQIDKIK